MKAMSDGKSPRKNIFPGTRAQAMVEFAIALPVLLVMLVGIMEVGRMIITYALVNNASRDAVRFASAVGRSDASPNNYKYNDCAAIKGIAKKSAFIVALSSITIDYYNAAGTYIGTCDATSGGDPDISVDSNYLVKVTVTASYKPVVKLIPIGQKNFTAISRRTFVGIFDLGN